MNIPPAILGEEEVASGLEKGRNHLPATEIVNTPTQQSTAIQPDGIDSDNSQPPSLVFDSISPQSSAESATTPSVPPRADELDRTLRHIGLEDFGKALNDAASAVFPSKQRSRYLRVFVLLIWWQTQDPKLPVEREISPLRKVLEEDYHYDVEEFRIPDCESHAEVSEKINAFVKVGKNSSSHLKIVYYAGHSRRSRTNELWWSSLPEKSNKKCPIVMWSGIQRSLEMANNDVLILLDCCSSGVAHDSEGNGITELICACPYDTEANGVGHYSFTQALTKELLYLSKKPCFSAGHLYNSIYRRLQSYLPQGVDNERYPPPVHFVLTQDENGGRGIKLSPLGLKVPQQGETEKGHLKRVRFEDAQDVEESGGSELPHPPNKRLRLGDSSSSRMDAFIRPWVEGTEAHKDPEEYDGVSGHSNEGSDFPKSEGNQTGRHAEEHSRKLIPKDSRYPQPAPRALFAVRFREDIRSENLSVDHFKEWLRSIPAAVEEVCVEGGFECFSTLLLITIPLSMSSYIPQHPAIFPLGAVKSSFILPFEKRNKCPMQSEHYGSNIVPMDGANTKRESPLSAEFEPKLVSEEIAGHANSKYDGSAQQNFLETIEYKETVPEGPRLSLSGKHHEIPNFEVSEPATIYVRNILDKFPLADFKLVQRLGESNWQRHIKARNRNEVSDRGLTACGAKSVFHDSGVGSSIPASGYAPSASSLVSKAGDADSEYFRVPPTPKEVLDDKPFECFICGHVVLHLKNRVDWKMHVFSDIRPYICAISPCKDALCTFSSRNEWAEHEFGHHWPSYQLALTSDRPNASQKHFDDLVAPIPDSSSVNNFNCPLCQKSLGGSKRNYISHVAKHMESIALATLPPNPEENSDDDSNASVQDLAEAHNDVRDDTSPLSVSKGILKGKHLADGGQIQDSTQASAPNSNVPCEACKQVGVECTKTAPCCGRCLRTKIRCIYGHPEYHACPIPTCGRLFKSSDHLKRHVRTHIQERPHICHHCNRAFSRSDNLRQHLRSHEGMNSCKVPHNSYNVEGDDLVAPHLPRNETQWESPLEFGEPSSSETITEAENGTLRSASDYTTLGSNYNSFTPSQYNFRNYQPPPPDGIQFINRDIYHPQTELGGVGPLLPETSFGDNLPAYPSLDMTYNISAQPSSIFNNTYPEFTLFPSTYSTLEENLPTPGSPGLDQQLSPIGHGNTTLYTPNSLREVDEGFENFIPSNQNLSAAADFQLFPSSTGGTVASSTPSQLFGDLPQPPFPGVSVQDLLDFSSYFVKDSSGLSNQVDWEGGPKRDDSGNKFVDSHLKPYRCKVPSCGNLQFSSTAGLLRHEREAHAMHGHGEKPYLCTYEGCDRGVPGNGFPRHWNLRDHMKRVHSDPGAPKSNASGNSPPPCAAPAQRRQTVGMDHNVRHLGGQVSGGMGAKWPLNFSDIGQADPGA